MSLLINTIFTYCITILVHELGHLAYFRWKGNQEVNIHFTINKLHIEVGTESDYWKMSSKDKIRLYLSGVLTGLIFLLFTTILIWTSWLLLIPYLWGCRKDVLLIWALINDKGVSW